MWVYISFVLLIASGALLNFIQENRGEYGVAGSFKVLLVGALEVIRGQLFHQEIIERLISWYVFLLLLNVAILEPLSTLSKRIPYGEVESIPVLYKGEWDNNGDPDINAKLIVTNDYLSYRWSFVNESGSANTIKCANPKIYYDFHRLANKYGHKFWYPVAKIFLYLVPDTIFGTQYIYWGDCSEKNYHISQKEPTVWDGWVFTDTDGSEYYFFDSFKRREWSN